MQTKHYFLPLGFALVLGLLGCGLTDTVISNVAGGSKGNTVANLWSDVPPIAGAQKLSIDLPLPMQLAIQGLIKNGVSGQGLSLNQFDWIAYTTTQTPDQVAAFYSLDRMTAAGWTMQDQPGCSSGSEAAAVAAGFCVFGKGNPGQQQTVLFVVLAQDSQSKQTQVFYVRLAGIVQETPTPGS